MYRPISLGLAAAVLSACFVVAPGTAQAASCPKAQFIGVRGSGETYQYGVTVGDVQQKVAARIPGSASAFIKYPAVAVGYGGWNHYPSNYSDSVQAGITNLTAYVRSFISRCSGTPLLLTGYSQGAHVVGNVVEKILSSSERAHVAGVVLIGDPRFKGDQSTINVGDYDPTENGVWVPVGGARNLPSNIVGVTRSYCQEGDPVCNFGLTNVVFCQTHKPACPHIHYIDWYYGSATYTGLAASYLSDKFHKAIGDLNRDWKIGCLDLAILNATWGQSGVNVAGDVNHDGTVNILDLSIMASHWTGDTNHNC